MILNIRGGLGTQVLELLGAYALAIEAGRVDEINTVHVSCGGEAWDGGPIENVLTDYVSAIFDGLPLTITTDNRVKVGVFKDWDILELILRHREKISEYLRPKSDAPVERNLSIIHVRTGNRCWVPLQWSIDFVRSHSDFVVVGNIPEDVAQVPVRSVSSFHQPVMDWFHLFNAKEIVGTSSTFLMSVLFVDPYKKVSMWRGQTSADFALVCRPLMHRFGPQFPNFQWIDREAELGSERKPGSGEFLVV